MQLEQIMKDETAGDPVSGCKWTRKSTYKIAHQLNRLHIDVCPSSVGRLLKAHGFCLRKNRKNIENAASKDRDPIRREKQFSYIGRQRRIYETQNLPVISIDTKSRELIGSFHQAGRRWSRNPIEVFDHDFPSQAQGIAIPYGIYDTAHNRILRDMCRSAPVATRLNSLWIQFGAGGSKSVPDPSLRHERF